MQFLEMSESSVLNIISGPSKERLSLTLFSQTKLKEPWVMITTEVGEEIMLRVLSVEREDGSDESFNVEATARIPYGPTSWEKVVLYYRTDRRVGKLRLRKQ